MSLHIIEKRRDLAVQQAAARQLLDGVEQRGGEFTDAERADYDAMIEKIESLSGDVRRLEMARDLQIATGDGPVAGRQAPENGDALIGMADRDVRRYSIVKAIRASAAAARGDRNAWRGAELEREASEAVEQRIGVAARGFYVPSEVFGDGERRDLNAGTATAGGNVVADDLALPIIELLRNRLVVRQAGATVLTGLVGDLAVPRQSGGGTAYWVGEGSAVTESQQTINQVSLTPHTVGAFTDYTRQLMLQSSIDVERFVRDDLAAILAIAIDYAALHGDDSVDANQPDGIASTSGIGSVAGGTNGAAPDWSDVVGLETQVAVDNADIGKLAYVTNAAVRGKLKTTVVGTDQRMIWQNGATPLNGYPAYVTNQVRSDLTKGTADGVCSALFFGNWSDLLIGMWGGLDVLVDPYTGSTSGTTRVVALQSVDVGVRHAESFAVMLDALTS